MPAPAAGERRSTPSPWPTTRPVSRMKIEAATRIAVTSVDSGGLRDRVDHSAFVGLGRPTRPSILLTNSVLTLGDHHERSPYRELVPMDP